MNQFIRAFLPNRFLFVLPILLVILRGTASAETVGWIGGPADPQWGLAENWDSNRVPGPEDDVIIACNHTVTLGVDSGKIRNLTVGGATGNGALNVDPGAILHTAGVVVGGASGTTRSLSYFSQSGGDISVAGDFVLGAGGSAAQAFFTSGRLMIEGALVLAAPGAEASVLALNGGGGEISAGNVRIGSRGTLVFDFLDGQSVKTLTVEEGIELAEGSSLTVRNAAQVRPGETYILLSGEKLSGTFSQVNLEGFDPSVRPVIEYDGGHSQVLLKIVKIVWRADE
jgi:hypothetical protein